jgi:hypothetical protein
MTTRTHRIIAAATLMAAVLLGATQIAQARGRRPVTLPVFPGTIEIDTPQLPQLPNAPIQTMPFPGRGYRTLPIQPILKCSSRPQTSLVVGEPPLPCPPLPGYTQPEISWAPGDACRYHKNIGDQRCNCISAYRPDSRTALRKRKCIQKPLPPKPIHRPQINSGIAGIEPAHVGETILCPDMPQAPWLSATAGRQLQRLA